jgi:hypothetical protein
MLLISSCTVYIPKTSLCCSTVLFCQRTCSFGGYLAGKLFQFPVEYEWIRLRRFRVFTLILDINKISFSTGGGCLLACKCLVMHNCS